MKPNCAACEAEAHEALERWKRFVESESIQEAGWDSSKQPRGGYQQNTGWWLPAGGSGAAPKLPAGGEPALGHSNVADSSHPAFLMVGNKTKKQGTTRKDSPTPMQPSENTKPPEGSDGKAAGSPQDEKLTREQLLTYFKLLYGEKGQKLLKAFEASTGLVKIESLWFGNKSKFSTRYCEQLVFDPDEIPDDALFFKNTQMGPCTAHRRRCQKGASDGL